MAQKRRPTALVCDASALIDFRDSAPHVLDLISRTIAPLCVVADVLAEVPNLPEGESEPLGIQVVEPTTQQLLQAGARVPGLSLNDRLCLIYAREHGYDCLTNDSKLRAACEREGVRPMWGLEAVGELVRRGCLSAQRATSIAWKIHSNNPHHISQRIIRRFLRDIGVAEGTSEAGTL